MINMIFGCGGQDGGNLTEQLLKKGDKVIGVVRRSSLDNKERINGLVDHEKFVLEYGDVTDYASILYLLNKHRPERIYNLAAMSFVGVSFEQPFVSIDVTEKGHVTLLEVVRHISGYNPRIYFAASSEMFGSAYQVDGKGEKFQDESTPMHPQSPYAIAKLAAYNYNTLYRKAYNMNTRSGILFNHDGPTRGHEFVTRKITLWLGGFVNWAKTYSNRRFNYADFKIQGDYIRYGREYYPKLTLGNIDTYRDFGHSKDYCKAMQLIMDYPDNEDFVIATQDSHSIREFLYRAFEHAKLKEQDVENLVTFSDQFKRPSEVPYLRGRPDKARNLLKWKPEYNFEMLVKEMVESDIKLCRGKI